MKTLSREQKDIILDYFFECASDEQTAQARRLLSASKGAVEFYAKLSDSLGELEHLDQKDCSDCPDYLVGAVLNKIDFDDTHSSSQRLGELLSAEQEKVVTKRPNFWRNVFEVAAIAAMVVFVSGIFVPAARYMRFNAAKTACSFNLSQIADGIKSYSNDNDDHLPAVAMSPGTPWWKVGSNSETNHSNTRHLWLLVRRGYLKPDIFVCPGTDKGKLIKISSADIRNYRDFPGRQYITYSFRLVCGPAGANYPRSSTVLMADSNPLFDSQACHANKSDKEEFAPIKLCEKLKKLNSRNHYYKGQNVLFSDGSVVFLRQRTVDSNDDIFTVHGLKVYRGIERPSSEKDIFLVP